MVDESYFDDLDRDFLKLSSTFSNIFSNTFGFLGCRLIAPLDPEKFDNVASQTQEIAIRVLIGAGFAAAAFFQGFFLLGGATLLGLGSKIFRGVGFALQKEGFTHVKGAAESSLEKGKATVMTWNIKGGKEVLFHYRNGLTHWSSRVDRIVEKILSENPDVLVLQEVYDVSLIEALIEKLKGDFAHFYIHLGANTLGESSGCMVMTKCAVHEFSHADFTNNSWDHTRGFETLEIKASPEDAGPCARIIGTQLANGKEAKEARMQQINQIVAQLALETLRLPTFFAGNSNFDRDSDEGAYLSQYLYHSYRDNAPTYTGELAKQWAPIYGEEEGSRDFISFFKKVAADGRVLPVVERNIRLLDCHLVKAFDETHNTKTALSDHHGVVTRFSGLKSALPK